MAGQLRKRWSPPNRGCLEPPAIPCATRYPPLDARNGVIGATTSIAVLYGGTGLTSAPTYGQLLLGNASGGYTLTATSSLGLPTFGYLFPSNATSTALTFSGGLLSLASTTIGNGDQTGGLTISGGATTTGFLKVLSTATSTFSGGLQTTALNVTSSSATSTFANGIQLAGGCFRMANGSCAGSGSASLTGTTGQVAYFSGTNTAVGTSSLFIASSGNVGIGTTTPLGRLTIFGGGVGNGGGFDGENSLNIVTNDSVGAGITLESTDTGGQSWSLTSNASDSVFDAGDFSIYDDTLEPRFIIQKTTGNVGIGTTSPWRTLSVVGTMAINGVTNSTASNSLCLDGTTWNVTRQASNSCLPSSIRYKHNVIDSPIGLAAVLELRPVSFEYNEDLHIPGVRLGLIAEEAAAVDPRLATYNASGTPESLDDFALISAAISAIKDIATLGATFKNTLVAWFADAANGITDFFAERVRTQELCVDDICVTRDQFAEVFGGSQSAAAAGAPSSGVASEAPDGSSANEIPDADAESIPPNDDDTTTAAATSSPEVLSPTNDNELGEPTSDAADQADQATTADETTSPEIEASPQSELEPANDNQAPDPLPATGTE